MTFADIASSLKLNCDVRDIAFSGHVATHIPHCKQASSLNSNCGDSGLSCRAPAGHALTQDRQIVQLSVFTLTMPQGELLGNGIISCLFLLLLDKPCIPVLKIPLGAPTAIKEDDFILV